MYGPWLRFEFLPLQLALPVIALHLPMTSMIPILTTATAHINLIGSAATVLAAVHCVRCSRRVLGWQRVRVHYTAATLSNGHCDCSKHYSVIWVYWMLHRKNSKDTKRVPMDTVVAYSGNERTVFTLCFILRACL